MPARAYIYWVGVQHSVDLETIRQAIPRWAYEKGRRAGVSALADACHLSRQTLYRMFVQGKRMTVPTLTAVLAELGIDFDSVVTPVQPPRNSTAA